MAAQLDCPSCGASIKVRREASSVICKYCGSSVMVPAHLAGSYRSSSAVPAKGNSYGKTVAILTMTAIFLVIGIGAFVFYLTGAEGKMVSQVSGDAAVPYEPAAELVVMEFGGPGTGSGYFTDPRGISVDSRGNIYVGERESGRIQVFDRNGCFNHQWSFADKEEEKFLSAMSCSQDGILYMVYDSRMYVHNGETGELLDSLQHPDGWGFQDVDVASDGSIVASWYRNRDDIILFANSREVELVIEEAISWQSGEPELNTTVIAGNTGEIYAFGSFNKAVFVFNSEGRFVNRFGNAEQFTMPFGFDVDTYGRLWVSDFGDLLLFDPSGELLMTIEPGVTVNDFVISSELQLYGITSDDTVVQIDISTY